MPPFVHLHLHSQYSLLDGGNRLGDLISAAGEADMPAVALTDHGNMFGAIEFYNKARAAGIKPIIGMEAYVAMGSRLDRDPGRSGRNHLVLLARDYTGYQNLLKLTSRSFLEGFYYKPRVDKELLRQHAEGLVGLSACLKGEVNELLQAGREKEAETAALEYRDIFGEGHFFLELQDHGIEVQRQVNELLRGISRRTAIPLVATNDCHYLRCDDAFAHDVLLCIGTQKVLSDPDRLRYATDQFYLKTGEEMLATFPKDGEALENTLAIAEICNLEIPSGEFHLPDFPVPEGHTLDSFLAEVARQGLERRLEQLRRRRELGLVKQPEEAYRRRLEEEIRVIQRMGFPGYFLIVWDFIRYAGEQGIPVGPGRGSAAGSLVSYALNITDIDPLQYDLLFERFLNPERISLPDIDIDFCMRRRGEVIQYVNEKYGRDRVAQIITFGTLAAKAVVRDVGRVMGIPYAKVDRIAKLVPEMTRSLAEAVEQDDTLRSESAADPEIQKLIEVGSRLEGLTRHVSTHAAGVVITPRPIEELVPLYKTNKDEVVTQWDKDVVEGLGLLKMDFLGLRTLTVIEDALKTLELQGIDVNLGEVPLDDPEVYCLFCEGRTNGIFQFESSGMKDLLRRAQPSKFEDLAAFNALYRPGALSVGMVEEFIQRKRGKKKVTYILPETQAILEETYGVIAYQEQVMQIAVEVAGFTMGEADVLRKAMGKKKPEVMAEQKQKFIAGAVERGFERSRAQELWEYIEPFAGYGFNKSHSVAYAMLAYKTAYLKTHYPVAFMAAMLSSEMSASDHIAKHIVECREMRIPVLAPDINESNWAFTVVGDSIRFGLGAVKGIGEGAVESILQARRRAGAFRSLGHFASEVDLKLANRKVFECLIKSGSFDSLGFHRGACFEALERILDYAQHRRREREAGQESLFSASEVPEPEPSPSTPHWPERERLGYERETLGFYLSGNPLSEHQETLEKLVTHNVAELREVIDSPVVVGGIVNRTRRNQIRSGPNAGRMMCRFDLEDLQGTVQVALFANQYQQFGALLEDQSVVLVRGSVRERGGELELRAEEVQLLDQASRKLCSGVELTLPANTPTADMLQLRDLLIENPGDLPVCIRLELAETTVNIDTDERFRIELNPKLADGVEEILGPGHVTESYQGGTRGEG